MATTFSCRPSCLHGLGLLSNYIEALSTPKSYSQTNKFSCFMAASWLYTWCLYLQVLSNNSFCWKRRHKDKSTSVRVFMTCIFSLPTSLNLQRSIYLSTWCCPYLQMQRRNAQSSRSSCSADSWSQRSLRMPFSDRTLRSLLKINLSSAKT